MSNEQHSGSGTGGFFKAKEWRDDKDIVGFHNTTKVSKSRFPLATKITATTVAAKLPAPVISRVTKPKSLVISYDGRNDNTGGNSGIVVASTGKAAAVMKANELFKNIG